MPTIYQKPDAIDTKTPNVCETPILYHKPNAYDEGPPVVTASRHGSRSSRITVDSFSSRYFQRRNPSITSSSSSTINESTFQSTRTFTDTPPSSPFIIKKSSLDKHITSSILSQPTSTTQTTIEIDNDEFYNVRPSSPHNSIHDHDHAHHSKNASDIVAAVAALLANDSSIVSSFFLQPNKNPKKTTNQNKVNYYFKKASIFKPNQHYIYLHEEGDEILAYRKIQPYSSWGLHSMLFCNRNDGQGIKVAEARRGAFKKEIVIESADYHDTTVEDISQYYIPKNKLKAVAANHIYCQDLVKRSQSNILFEYETWFHGSLMRWKRISLLSHDFTCEIKLTNKKLLEFNNRKKKKRHNEGFIDSDSDDDDDDHDNHSHKTCRRWKLIAEFHSHSLNFLNQNFGTLSIDLDILNQVEKERCDLLEANLIMTCSTLIDLIREIMGK